MKLVLLIIAICTAIGTALAQSANIYTNNTGKKKETAKANEFANTEMVIANGQITLNGLPNMDKEIWVVINDSEGNMVKQTRISARYNTVAINKLRRGVYFVSVVYRNHSKKSFMLNI